MIDNTGQTLTNASNSNQRIKFSTMFSIVSTGD